MTRKRDEGLRPVFLSARPWAVALCALAWAAGAQAADLPSEKANECNSDIMIETTPASPVMVGQTLSVTLTIESTNARDNLDNPIAQEFDTARYGGDCSAFFPCVPSMPAAAMFQGNVGGTCPSPTANPMGNGLVEFDFAPALSLAEGASCQITFDMVYNAPGTFAEEANITGTCQNPSAPIGTYTSDTTVTDVLTVVAPPEPWVDKQVSCDDGATWTDVNGDDDPMGATVAGCTGWSGVGAANEIQFRYRVQNLGGETATSCSLSESNSQVFAPAMPLGDLPAGYDMFVYQTMPALACETVLTGGEPNTATLTCTNAPPVTDVATLTCGIKVPTMGEVAVAVLALLLGIGSVAILSRRESHLPTGF